VGVGGYERLLQILADPAHEDHDDLLSWVGGSFDPEAFDIAAINQGVQAVSRIRRRS
jgi:hypothetical protein